MTSTEERVKRVVDEFYPLAEKRHNDAFKEALVAAVRGGRGSTADELKARVERLEANVAFLARFLRLSSAGHPTGTEFDYLAKLAARTERWSESEAGSA